MRVKQTLTATTATSTYFVKNYYEVAGGSATKYYYLGSQRVAMRSSVGLRYLFGDHLGSTSVSADGSGGNVTKQLYKAFGEIRYSTNPSLPAKYQYTGQYSYTSGAAADFGLIFYNARFYDPALGRFSSADTIVPGAGNPAAWDRYAGMLNNPINSIDPTGHGCIRLGNRMSCSDLFPDLDKEISSNVSVALDREIDTPWSQYNVTAGGFLSGNLCGFISAEIVAEAIMGHLIPLQQIVDLNPTKEMIEPKDVEYLVENTVPGVKITVVMWGSPDSLKHIVSCVKAGKYVIVHVRVDPKTGKLIPQEFVPLIIEGKPTGKYDPRYLANHYVVIKEISDNKITVINPLNNDQQSYSPKEFEASFSKNYLVITPPSQYSLIYIPT